MDDTTSVCPMNVRTIFLESGSIRSSEGTPIFATTRYRPSGVNEKVKAELLSRSIVLRFTPVYVSHNNRVASQAEVARIFSSGLSLT